MKWRGLVTQKLRNQTEEKRRGGEGRKRESDRVGEQEREKERKGEGKRLRVVMIRVKYHSSFKG